MLSRPIANSEMIASATTASSNTKPWRLVDKVPRPRVQGQQARLRLRDQRQRIGKHGTARSKTEAGTGMRQLDANRCRQLERLAWRDSDFTGPPRFQRIRRRRIRRYSNQPN